MKNKLTLIIGRAVFCLLLFALFLFQSCKKETNYLSQLPDSNTPLIKEADIQKWFATNLAGQLLSPDWKNAKQAVINGKNIVRVPILNIDKTDLLKTGKNSAPNISISSGVSLRAKNKSSSTPSTIKGMNTNYYEEHPPEIFFVQKNGSNNLGTFLLNFVPTDPKKEFGKDGIWTGKLYDWNLSGDTIYVQDFVKSQLVEKYGLRSAEEENNGQSNLSGKVKINSIGGSKTSGFFDWLAGKLGDLIGWIGHLFGLSYYNGNVNNSGGGWRIDWGPGSSGDLENQSFAPTEIYSSYLDGGGGNYTPFPYGGPSDPNSGSVVLPASVIYLVATLGITNTNQMDFLAANSTISDNLASYLQINTPTTTNNELALWLIDYLSENQGFLNNVKTEVMIDLYGIHSTDDITEFKSLITLSKDLYDFDNLVNSSQFDFMNDDWLARLREKARRLSELPRNIAQNVKQKIKAQLDAALVTSLKGTAKSIWPQVDGATYYSAKLSEFNNNADHGVAILLWEFATGSGEDVWNFNHDQDITQKFIEGRVLPEVFSDFYAKINEFNLSYIDFKNRTAPLNASLGFSPDHISITESVNKHLNSNLVQFFIGGAVSHYMPSNEDGWVEVNITNATSRSSLFLHIADNYARNGSVNQPLSTTQQNFKFKIKIDKTKFH